MPSLGGFFVELAASEEWAMRFDPILLEKHPRSSPGILAMAIRHYLKELKRSRLLDPVRVPTPDEPDCIDEEDWYDSGVMLVRNRRNEKVYIHPRPGFDTTGRTLIKERFGLNVSEWKVLWYDENDGNRKTEFLEPPL